jgi:hypothetical protein
MDGVRRADRIRMVLGVQLASFVAVVLGMEMVGMRDVGMVRSLLVVTGGVGLRRLAVVLGGMLVVLRGPVVVIQLLLVGHDDPCFEVYIPVIGDVRTIAPLCFDPASVG